MPSMPTSCAPPPSSLETSTSRSFAPAGSRSRLTRFRRTRYDRTAIRGGLPIRSAEDKRDAGEEFERLEKAVAELVDRYTALKQQNSDLTEALRASKQRIASLESEVRQGNHLRADVAKRIDDLVGQIDQVEMRFAAGGS